MTLALVRLLGHPEERESLGRRAQAKIRSGFTWPGFAGKIVQILEEEYDYVPSGGRHLKFDAVEAQPGASPGAGVRSAAISTSAAESQDRLACHQRVTRHREHPLPSDEKLMWDS